MYVCVYIYLYIYIYIYIYSYSAIALELRANQGCPTCKQRIIYACLCHSVCEYVCIHMCPCDQCVRVRVYLSVSHTQCPLTQSLACSHALSLTTCSPSKNFLRIFTVDPVSSSLSLFLPLSQSSLSRARALSQPVAHRKCS